MNVCPSCWLSMPRSVLSVIRSQSLFISHSGLTPQNSKIMSPAQPPPPPGEGAQSDGDLRECLCPADFGSPDGGSFGEGSDGRNHNCPHCKKFKSTEPSPSHSFAICETNSDKVRRVVSASFKGFSIGAGLKGGLSLFSLLARLSRRRKSPSSTKNTGALSNTNSEDIKLIIKETLRYGLFLGTFAGTFVSVDEIIASLGGHRRTAKWRALVAGGIAGPSMLLTGLNTQHTSLAVYILMRAAVLASRCGIKSKRFASICKPLTWAHGDIFLMCLSSSQILSAYILKQDCLPSSYKSFLNKHGGKDMAILQGVKEITTGMPFSDLERIEKYYKAMGVNIKLDPEMTVPCSIVHGNQSCVGHVLSFLIQAYKRALPVYLPVYLVPALIVHRQDLLKRPCTILGKSVFGIARSSLFLSTYCTSAWMWTCILFWIFRTCNIPILVAGTFPTGFALAIEKKSRRIEISLYCFARAIESFFTCMADVGYLPQMVNVKRADVAVFSLSTAIIMHCYAQEREVFRSKYLNVLDWVFGVPPPPCYTPRCSRKICDPMDCLDV